jgi:hypothetical protein
MRGEPTSTSIPDTHTSIPEVIQTSWGMGHCAHSTHEYAGCFLANTWHTAAGCSWAALKIASDNTHTHTHTHPLTHSPSAVRASCLFARYRQASKESGEMFGRKQIEGART